MKRTGNLRLAAVLGKAVEPAEDRAASAAQPGRQLRRDVMAILAKADGPRAAAWLTWEYRRQLRRAGAFDLLVPAGAAEPVWLQVAIKCLRSRKWWAVEYRPTATGYKYRITWRAWRKGAA